MPSRNKVQMLSHAPIPDALGVLLATLFYIVSYCFIGKRRKKESRCDEPPF